jgi:hypothetical protein
VKSDAQKKKNEQNKVDMKNEMAPDIERNKIMLRTHVDRDDRKYDEPGRTLISTRGGLKGGDGK